MSTDGSWASSSEVSIRQSTARPTCLWPWLLARWPCLFWKHSPGNFIVSFILLFGLADRNGLLLVDNYNRRHTEGKEIYEVLCAVSSQCPIPISHHDHMHSSLEIADTPFDRPYCHARGDGIGVSGMTTSMRTAMPITAPSTKKSLNKLHRLRLN